MRWLRYFRRTEFDREELAELESYEQIETDENIARGMSPPEALAAARRKLGNRTLIREEIYEMNTMIVFDRLSRDIRHGWRMLIRNPAFTLTSLLTLAIGIGANIAVFSVVNSVLLRPLAYPESDRLVAVAFAAPGAAGLATVSKDLLLSPSMYTTFSEQDQSFQSFGVWTSVTASVTGIAEPEQVRAAVVSDGVLQALSVPPAIGRWLAASDQKPGSPETLMLTYEYWQRRFGGESSAVGKTILVDARPRQIVGVMPEGFRFLKVDADLIVPARFDRNRLILAGFGYRGVARLKPGVTIARADSDIARLVPVWMNSWTNGPGTNPRVYEQWRITPALRPLKEEVIGNVGSVLWVLMSTIGIVMLIACASVANLLLVRAEARQRELAVRAALGAAWGRIVHELLVEAVLLALLGGALGLAVAQAGVDLLRAAGPANLPRLSEISIDQRALLFTLAISVLSGLLFGFIPALKYAAPAVATALRGGRTASASREQHRARNVLVIAQVALALVLLICSGLMIRTFQALRAVQPGFTHPEHIQTMSISIPPSLVRDPEQVARIHHEIAAKLAQIPDVSSVACSTGLPMEGLFGNWDAILTEQKPDMDLGAQPMRMFQMISPGLFQTMGTRMIAGRDFNWTDLFDHRPVVIVSENLARELWGSPSAAIGKRIRRVVGAWREVVGVVENVQQNGVTEAAPSIVYWPELGTDLYDRGRIEIARTVNFAIRSERVGTENFLDQVRKAVWSVNGNLPLASVRTLQEIYDQSLARASFALVMLAIAGAMALVLGIIGIYGVISYSVSLRQREIGVRLALGAPAGALERMFIGYALTLAGIGAAIGLAASAGLTRLMRALLFGVTPLDPPTFAAVAGVLLMAAALASYLPARRAAAVDPVIAMKVE